MSKSLKFFSTFALAIVFGLALHAQAIAQSGSSNYGEATVSGIRNNNNASRFSVSRIQADIQRRSISRAGARGVNQRNFLSSSPAPSALTAPTKPFSGVSQGPTVSPYLALSAPRASASDYYSVIRPQQQQRQASRQQQIQSLRQRQRLSQLAARAPYSATGDESRAPTGHAAVFQSLGTYQNTGGYFPPPSPPKRN